VVGHIAYKPSSIVDRIRTVGYAEDTVQWTTDTAQETDSQSDSSDSE